MSVRIVAENMRSKRPKTAVREEVVCPASTSPKRENLVTPHSSATLIARAALPNEDDLTVGTCLGWIDLDRDVVLLRRRILLRRSVSLFGLQTDADATRKICAARAAVRILADGAAA